MTAESSLGHRSATYSPTAADPRSPQVIATDSAVARHDRRLRLARDRHHQLQHATQRERACNWPLKRRGKVVEIK
eukprot:48788-Chlamydomonas_euryale.AAC.1